LKRYKKVRNVIEKHDRVFIEYPPSPKDNGFQISWPNRWGKKLKIPLNYKLLEKSKTTKRLLMLTN